MKRVLVGAVLLLLWSSTALAARNASVSDSGGTLRSAPETKAEVITPLQPGEAIEISNYPTQGFYKARTAAGKIGWVPASSVNETPAPEFEPMPEHAPPPKPLASPSPFENPTPLGSPTETHTYEDVPAYDVHGESRTEPILYPRYPYELKVFAGMQVLSEVLSFDEIGVSLPSSMPYIGLQFGIPLDQRLSLVFRIERLSTSTSEQGFDFSFGATPLTGGLSYSLLSEKAKMRLQLSLLMGVAFATTLDVTANTQPPPNFSELSTQAFTEMLKLDLGIPLSKSIQLYAEGGYRFLNSGSVGPSPAGNGSDIFKQDGVVTPVNLNLSGFFLGGGLAFLF